jgi:hypothetical protein
LNLAAATTVMRRRTGAVLTRHERKSVLVQGCNRCTCNISCLSTLLILLLQR